MDKPGEQGVIKISVFRLKEGRQVEKYPDAFTEVVARGKEVVVDGVIVLADD